MTAVTLADGRHFAYRKAGRGDVLVLLHGWSMSSAVFQEVMAGLAPKFRILAPDLTGHGASEAASVNFDLDTLAGDIEEWLGKLGINRICLLGWSLGGQVAMQLASRGKIQVAKMILVATTPLFVTTTDWGHGLPLTQVRAMDRQMQRHYEQSMGEFFRLMFEGEEMTQERYRDILRFAVRDGSLPTREISRTGLKVLGSTDLRSRLAYLHLPVLVHYGSLDLITLPAACRYLAKQIPGARQVEWDHVGHAPFLSRPNDAVELWATFLQ